MGEKSFLERIASYIPGYGGYKSKEVRRESDALLRRHIASILSESLAVLTLSPSDVRAVAASPEARYLWESVKTALERVLQRIDKAPHGYAGFFDLVKIDDSVLDAVYRHDLSLVEYAREVFQQAAAVKSLKAGSSEWVEALRRLQTSIEKLDVEIDQRRRVLRRVG
ncbi:MAG: hypothetical protein ACK4M3_02720 [Pyrobaculum sp.]